MFIIIFVYESISGSFIYGVPSAKRRQIWKIEIICNK